MFGKSTSRYKKLLSDAKAENDELIAAEDQQALGVCTCAACWKQIDEDEFRINLNGNMNVHVSCYGDALAISGENYARAKVRASMTLAALNVASKI